jgi:hypothetical protein
MIRTRRVCRLISALTAAIGYQAAADKILSHTIMTGAALPVP